MGFPVEPPPMANPGFTAADVQAMIDKALEQQQATHETEMQDLRDIVTAQQTTLSGLITTVIREHGAGVGTANAPTWSQWEQELAARGEHPSQVK